VNQLRALVDQPDLVIAALLAVLGGLASIGPLDGFPLLRAALTIPLVLFLPGFALVSALFPSLVVPSVERILMAIGGSIAMAVLLGLVLGISPLGFAVAGWAGVLVTLTLVLLLVAWLRRTRARIDGPRPHGGSKPLRAALLFGVSILIVADVVLGARLAATDAQAPVPVQLWLIPVSGAHEQARLGMRSGPDGGQFHIALTTAGQTIHDFDLTLDPEQTWETIVLFPPEIRAQPIVARLYENGSDQESRFVTLQPVTDAASPAPSGLPPSTVPSPTPILLPAVTPRPG
jgi:hypothetical protein